MNILGSDESFSTSILAVDAQNRNLGAVVVPHSHGDRGQHKHGGHGKKRRGHKRSTDKKSRRRSRRK